MKDRSDYFRKVAEEKKKTHKRVQVTLTIQEYREFEKIAQKEGVTVSKVILNMAVAYKSQNYFLPRELKDSLSEFNRVVRGIANNINQLSRSANLFREVDGAVVFNHLRELEKKVSDFISSKAK